MANGKRLPEIITVNANRKLMREYYLGKGGFGRCYALKCSSTGKGYAGKFLDKEQLKKHNVAGKVVQEIKIHKDLVHDNIVRFKSFIEDSNYIYILLELCENRSMLELMRRRQLIRTFEAKYYMKQVVAAVSYLHDRHVIHRDLKLANLFINHKMVVKVGDFGLAVKVNDNKSRRSLCGTPNYIAPEVLSREGHSYAVDVWALGCILYTLLLGRTPFHSKSIKQTYNLIANCEYTIPDTLTSTTASNFIVATLQKDPQTRPTIYQLANHDFLNLGFIPGKLPPSSIVMPPRNQSLLMQFSRETIHQSNLDDTQLTKMMQTLHDNIQEIVAKGVVSSNIDDTQNPSLRPFIWINSWMNHSNNYSFSYRLNDNTVGTLFNDNTTLLILPSGKIAHYFDSSGCKSYFNTNNIGNHPHLKEKVKILKSCRDFIFNTLRNAYEEQDDVNVEPLSCLPILKTYINTENVVGMLLSNGTLQINFSLDHVKLILCPLLGAVTVITYANQPSTYQLDLFYTHGCQQSLLTKLHQTIDVIQRIVTLRNNTSQ